MRRGGGRGGAPSQGWRAQEQEFRAGRGRGGRNPDGRGRGGREGGGGGGRGAGGGGHWNQPRASPQRPQAPQRGFAPSQEDFPPLPRRQGHLQQEIPQQQDFPPLSQSHRIPPEQRPSTIGSSGPGGSSQQYDARPQTIDSSGSQRGEHVPSGSGVASTSAAAAPSPESLVPGVKALGVEETHAGPSAPASSKALVPPPRPDEGTRGVKGAVRVNHFAMTLKEGLVICRYNVEIHPSVGSKGMARAVERQLVQQYRATKLGNCLPVYDGSKILYTAGELPFEGPEDFEVTLEAREGSTTARKFQVTIEISAQLDQIQMRLFVSKQILNAPPYELIQALDVALREWPSSKEKYVPCGRSFFSSCGSQALGGGFEAWSGFYQSVRPTQRGLTVNIDMSASAFYEKKGVIDFLEASIPSFDPSRRMSDEDRSKAVKLLSRLKVVGKHRPDHPRKYRISGLSFRPTSELTFTVADNNGQEREMKVLDYFAQTYPETVIQYHELPCLELQGRRTTYLPMEVCTLVAGQRYQGKLNERQTTKMLQFTRETPLARKERLTNLRNDIFNEQNVYTKEFGIQVSERMMSLPARTLPTPRLKYYSRTSGQITDVIPENGQWNMMSYRFLRGAQIRHWTVVNFTQMTKQDVQSFIAALRTRCQNVGLAMSPPIPPSYGGLKQYEKLLRDAVRKSRGHDLQLVVCIMSSKHRIYGDLKKLCDTELGVVTQCCLERNIQKKTGTALSAYLNNLAMKINVKAGGKNVELSQELSLMPPLSATTIIFGADVSHPMAHDRTTSSISAVVASVDWPSATTYLSRARAQDHRVEMITHLQAMVAELINEFKAHKGELPEKILFFRDGVSEGQFYKVLEFEVKEIEKACWSIKPDYRPPITFVVVQKRHHTRFFPASDRPVDNTNVRPGTVVDTGITHPREFDFYLCSHPGGLGISRPAHYHVLLDENGFSADQLQVLINNLCYTYARCTKAISVVPPAHYAHLVAYRARLYLDPHGGSGTGASSSQAADLPPVSPSIQRYMYYC